MLPRAALLSIFQANRGYKVLTEVIKSKMAPKNTPDPKTLGRSAGVRKNISHQAPLTIP